MVFDGIKKRADVLINDRVTAPVRLAVIVSIAAFIMGGIALIVVANRAAN
jgi:hypothetical protein